MNSLCENVVSGDYSVEVLIPKKDHFRDKDENVNMDLLVDHVGQPTASWKEKLVGSSSNIGGEDLEVKEDFKDMKNTVVLKLLRCNIGFSILQNKIYSMWKPSSTVHLIDIENGFFLAKFVNKIDYEKVLFEGLWIIFGQYLTVQPWTVLFDPTQKFLSMVMSWIRFSGLPGYMYKRKILLEIGRLVGKVTKLDMNMDNRVKGKFARMVVYVTLDRPLVSQVLINGKIQRVEYEFLLKARTRLEVIAHGRVPTEPKLSLIRKLLRVLKHSKAYKYTPEEKEKRRRRIGSKKEKRRRRIGSKKLLQGSRLIHLRSRIHHQD
ncbi:hypothetical protein CXB51_003854 [Gossypium anomalum]|uniref:DUF4283 domain-containing protein n=1 Tax=Gossypium anomalum TaxID=47600 RepID=A0A8J6DBU9_9ROSI|nr:hypothetical protein CXB51_003854 [Gossypium anomalum]